MKANSKSTFLLLILLLLTTGLIETLQAQTSNDFTIINPYKKQKPYQYKGSFHNHTQFHPEYMHSQVPTPVRLTDYRDYDTEPKYGIIGISDHNRVTHPGNTELLKNTEKNGHPWGIDDLLWLPGNESTINNYKNVRGHMIIVNASTEQVEKPDWTIRETPKASGGFIYTSNPLETYGSVSLKFTGTGFSVIGCKGPTGGITEVFVDDNKLDDANYYAKDTLYSQLIFSTENLADAEHTILIKYKEKGNSVNEYLGDFNVEKIVVIQQDGTEKDFLSNNPKIEYLPNQYSHASYPKIDEKDLGELFGYLRNEGCFLTLAHPNSRLVTHGEHKGKQLWSSSGYVYEELDLIFGNKEKGIAPITSQPHALEIGNRGYDFSERTGYKNAEDKWDYLLKQGHRIWGVGSDDSHGSTPKQGWVVINTMAPNRKDLSKEDVMESLFSGNFYASQGPAINIKVEGNIFTVSTDQPSYIQFITAAGVVKSEKEVTTLSYTITGDEVYVRGQVTRKDRSWHKVKKGIGRSRSAWTNPLYIERK